MLYSGVSEVVGDLTWRAPPRSISRTKLDGIGAAFVEIVDRLLVRLVEVIDADPTGRTDLAPLTMIGG